MATMKLGGEMALVTGASRGFGRAIAVRLARDGAAAVVNYAGNADAARQVVAEIESAGGRAVAVQGDVARVADGASGSRRVGRAPRRRSAPARRGDGGP